MNVEVIAVVTNIFAISLVGFLLKRAKFFKKENGKTNAK